MKVSITAPELELLDRFHRTLGSRAFSYPEQSATRNGDSISGYDNDDNKIHLGHGSAVYSAAKAALESWNMFPNSWVLLYPGKAEIRQGQEVAVLFRMLGFWWFNACRIVYVLNEPHRFGFAYGTLHGHVECGEERFMVYQDKEGEVWYQITAFSRPDSWMTRIGYPLARWFQTRFVRESLRRMYTATQQLQNA